MVNSIQLCLFAVAIAAVYAQTPVAIPPNTPIGILGGGASGITTGVILRELGFTDITLVDQDSHVGGVADSFLAHGKIYDTATMFVPGGSFSGDGVEPTLARMMAYSGEIFTEAVNFNFFDTVEGETTALPSDLTESDSEIKRQLLAGMNISIGYYNCLQASPLTANCLTCGVCDALGETVVAWGARTGLTVYARLISSLLDGLGGNPGAFFPIARGAVSSFVAVDAMFALKQLNVRYRDIRQFSYSVRRVLIQLYRSPRWYSFPSGYESFWESVVVNTDLKTERNSKVESMTRNGFGGWDISVSNPLRPSDPQRTLQFGIVIVTTPPAQAIQFLPDSEQRNLMATAGVASPPNDVFLADVEFGNQNEAEEVFSYWPSGLGIGLSSILAPRTDVSAPASLVKPIFWLKRHADRKVLTIGTVVLSGAVTPDDAFEAAKEYAAANLNIEVKNQLAHRRYLFPSAPSDPVAWSQWPALQGQNASFFTGEAFSGSGIPSIAFYNNLIWPLIFQSHPGGLSTGYFRTYRVKCYDRLLGIQAFVFAAAAVGMFFAGKKRGERVEKRKSMDMRKQLQLSIEEQNNKVESTVSAVDSDFVVTVENADGRQNVSL